MENECWLTFYSILTAATGNSVTLFMTGRSSVGFLPRISLEGSHFPPLGSDGYMKSVTNRKLPTLRSGGIQLAQLEVFQEIRLLHGEPLLLCSFEANISFALAMVAS
jgi:hypothetical protein